MVLFEGMNDTYCPEGHLWISVKNNIIFEDYYYCKECDELYVVRPVKLNKPKWSDEQMKRLIHQAEICEARTQVKYSDLIKLGLLKEVYL